MSRRTVAPHRAVTSSLALTLALILLIPAAWVWAADPPAGQPGDLLAAARRLLKEGKQQAAESLLLQAIKAGPASPMGFLTLAELYEATGRKEEALELYGHVLAKIDPRHERAREHFRRLFYEGRFPRELAVAYLKLSPVAFTVDNCKLAAELHTGSRPDRGLVYTNSLLFPEELRAQKAAPWVRLPASGTTSDNLMYNRMVYGMLVDPDGRIARTRWAVGYPSATILLSGNDYTALAGRLLQVVLRAHVYLQEYLGIDRRPAAGDHFRVFLTEEGPTGAEQFEDSLFFYDVDHDRGPREWLREVLHETGHLLLPRVGPFPGDERWANGDLGECLLFQWLLEEAGSVVADPWPSAPSAEALDKMWNTGHVAAHDFLLDQCRLPLAAWLATPPESFAGEDAAARFVGFCLWVQAANGRQVLGATLRTAAGAAPADFVAAYKAAVAALLARGSLRVDAGALNPVASKLAAPPREGAVRREAITLAPAGRAAYRVYLPSGHWCLRLEALPADQAGFLVRLDGKAGPEVKGSASLDLGVIAEGWHEMVVTSGAAAPVELLALVFGPVTG